MITRAPNSISDQTTLFNINKINRDIMKVQEELSTGKRINRPEDDPAGAFQIVKYKSDINHIEKYISSSNLTIDDLNTSDLALDQLGVVLRRIRDLSLYASNGTMTASDRNDILQEVEELREEFVSVANTTHRGNYIFSGGEIYTKPFQEFNHNNQREMEYMGDRSVLEQKISSMDSVKKNIPGIDIFYKTMDRDTLLSDINLGKGFTIVDPVGPPAVDNEFEYTAKDGNIYNINLNSLYGDGNADVGDMIDMVNSQLPGDSSFNITASGDGFEFVDRSTATASDMIVRDLLPNDIASQLKINFRSESGKITGQPLQPVSSVFGALFRLEDALTNNAPEKIFEGLVTEFDEANLRFTNVRAKIGARVNRTQLTQNQLTDVRINFKNLVGKIEDVDMSEAVLRLQRLQTSQQLTLQVGGSIMKMTLMDFI
ncbi:flagellar hook-associated protein FlgL [bacterium]|nr:flagellar hook-associated protein FlgL [bacterium]